MTRGRARVLGLGVGALFGIAAIALWGALRHEPRGAMVAELFVDKCFGKISGDMPSLDGAPLEWVNGPDGIALRHARSEMIVQMDRGDCAVWDVLAHLSEAERADAFEAARREFVALVPGAALDRIDMPSSFDPFLAISRPVAPDSSRPVPALLLLRVVEGDPEDPVAGSTMMRLVTDPDAASRRDLEGSGSAPAASRARNGPAPPLLSLRTGWRAT